MPETTDTDYIRAMLLIHWTNIVLLIGAVLSLLLSLWVGVTTWLIMPLVCICLLVVIVFGAIRRLRVGPYIVCLAAALVLVWGIALLGFYSPHTKIDDTPYGGGNTVLDKRPQSALDDSFFVPGVLTASLMGYECDGGQGLNCSVGLIVCATGLDYLVLLGGVTLGAYLTKKEISNGPIAIIACSVGVAVLIASVYVVSQGVRYLYIQNHPLDDPQYGFRYLEPKRLPPSVKIVAKRIDVNTPNGELIGIDAELNLRPVDWVYAIQESKAGAYGSEPVTTSLNNFDQTSVQPTCRQENTPADKSYRLCHWIDYGFISVYEIKFVQDGTFIDARIPTSVQKRFTFDALNDFVDSFAPAPPPSYILRGGI